MGRKLYGIVGESGCGKSAAASLLGKYGIHQILAHTTRVPRYAGENTNIFSDTKTFAEHIEQNLVFEHSPIFDKNIYWTLNSNFEYEGARCKVLEPNGILHYKNFLPNDIDFIVIYIKADITIRINRILERFEDKENHIHEAMARIGNDKKFFGIIECDYVIDNNGTLEELDTYLQAIINK
jgi:guanylate kinase